MLEQEGYIKFNCQLIKHELDEFPEFVELNNLRTRLWHNNLVGVDANGVGYGNVSVRVGNSNKFIITASATGYIADLKLEHYTKVIFYDFARNTLTCEGRFKASSESLSHAAIYESDMACQVVVHIHNLELWEKLLHKVPTVSFDAAYGTPEMALAIKTLFVTTDVKLKKVIVMGGHKSGILFFGCNINEVATLIDGIVK